MTKGTEIKCTRCGIDVPADKIALENRCNDKLCPVAELARQRAAKPHSLSTANTPPGANYGTTQRQ